MKKMLLLSVMIVGFGYTFGQNISMTNGSGSGCAGNLLDPGGTGNYGNSQNITYTFCPSTPGAQVVLNFTTFDLENGFDFLTVYNGTSAAAPTLGVYTGVVGPGIAQGTNPSGCLTLVFTSNASGTATGFIAGISCTNPCQSIIASLGSSVPATTGALYVDVCPGDNVSFTGTGAYPQNNTAYTQSDATSSFTWNFGDGGTGSGQTASHTYTSPGIYDLDIYISDIEGCVNNNDVEIYVRVSDDPVFSGTSATLPSICLGETNTLTGVVAPTTIQLDCSPPIAGLTYLPDGSGVSYETFIPVDCFAQGQTLTTATQLEEICVDMEHSYLGDLQLEIICPNGQSAILKAYPGGGGTYLGDPIDTGPGPGTGFTYCFDNFATTLLVNAPTVTAGTPAGNSKAPGTYQPVQSFNNLVGCPMNGNWTLKITDNLGIDDGYIFGWSMSFDNSALPSNYTYTPSITSSNWQPDPSIIASSGNSITVQPASSGTACYTYEATDEFGCTYDTTVCFIVNAPGTAGCPACNLNNLNVLYEINNCENELVTTGTVEFTDAPGSGNLIVEDCQGNQVIADSYPFSSPASFTLTGTDADGAGCSVHAYFSALPSCEISVNYTNPLATPPDEAGTISATQNGDGITNFILCDQDDITVTSNNDWSIPAIAPGNDPGLGYLVYSCPPTVYGSGVDPGTDPCYVGYIDLSNFNLLNNGGSADPFLASLGTLTDQTFYVVPMTFGSLSSVTYNPDCYELDPSQTVEIQYLNPIVPTVAQDCYAGTASVTLNGGYPEFYGGNYTASGLSPAGASFNNTTAASGGTIVISGLQDGDNWSFTVTDNNGCPKLISGTFTGVQDASFTYPSASYCADAANPSPVITGISGGSFSSAAGLSINGSTGVINLAASTPGTYTVTYTSPGPTCAGTETFDITINALPTVNAGADQVVCEGTAITLSGSGADSYSWNNGAANGVAFTPGVGTTTYTVTGTTTATGCSNTDIVQVTVNPLPTVNAGTDQSVCDGVNVTLNGSGANSYSWDNGVTNGISFAQPVGTVTYTVTGTSVAGCSSMDQVNITVNALPAVNAGPDQAVCIGGSVTLSASGATSYSWNNGISDGVSFTPATTTVYTVNGTDANGCQNTDQVTVTVLNATPVNAGPDQTICAGQSATLSATGAVSYTWNNGLGAGNNFSVSPAGTTSYTVTGTDANGCTGSDQLVINVNALPLVNAGADQTVCQNTSVTLNGSGASTYIWNNGVTNGTAFTPTIGMTTYTVTGTDANGCQNTDQVDVTVNPLPTVSAGPDQSVCIGGAVTLSGSGAVSYNWDNGVNDGASFVPASTTTYTVNGTDANGCQNSDQVTVMVLPSAPINAGADQTICAGESVILTASGGVSYSWNNGLGAGNNFSVSPATTTTYTATGTDINGCTGFDQLTITVNSLPNVNAGANQVVCDGVAVTLSGSGATNYSWDNGVSDGVAFTPAVGTLTYTLTGTDANGCQNTDQVDVTVNPLPAITAGPDQVVCAGAVVTLNGSGAPTLTWNNGVTDGVSFTPASTTTYMVTGTDANGCQDTDQAIVTVNPLPAVNAGSDQTVCDGTPVTLSGSGAVSYTWNNGISDGVSFTQAVGTVVYTVTGTDANGCQNTDQVSVTVNPNPNPVINGPTEYCEGFSATLSTSQTYTTYNWSTGDVTATSDVTIADNPINVTVTNSFGCSATSGNFTVTENSVITANFNEEICQGQSILIHGVSQSTAGTYSQTFTSATGCDSISNVTLVVHALPNVNAGTDQALCTPATITLTASGASTYVWDNGVTNGVPFSQAVGTITYTVSGTDANGCVNSDVVDVTVNPLPAVNAGSDFAVCTGDQATLNGSGAVSYTWNNGVTDGTAFTPAATNSYTVTGTDANGCQSTDQVNITVNPLPAVNAGNDFAVCTGDQATLNASGAVSYTWTNGVTDGVAFTPTTTNTYTVTGTDANGCQNIGQLTLTVNSLPLVNAGADVQVCDNNPLTLTGSATGNGPFSFNWDNGITDGTAFTQPVGTVTYTVTGTDANGCQNTDATDVLVNALPPVDAGTDFAICAGDQATLSGSGANTYTWNNGITDGTAFTPAATNSYTVTGTDVNGCQNTDQVILTVNALPNVVAGPDQQVCSGFQVTLAGSGADSYSWDNGVADGIAFTPGSTTNYIVTGTDANGCQNSDQLTVTVNDLPVADAGADQTVCENVPVTLSGSATGNGPFVFTWDNGANDGIAFNPLAGTTTFTLTVTDVNGCTDNDPADVTMNPLPAVNAGADQTVCEGTAVTLSGSGAVSYTWDNNIGDGVAFIAPTGTTTYTVIGTDANGCQNSDQVDVTEIANPVVFAGNDLTICAGDQVVLSGSGATNYNWDNGVANAAPFAPLATTTYTVTGTIAGGCSGTDDVTVTVNPLPQPTYVSNVTEGCAPLAVRFNGTTANAADCNWAFSDGSIYNGCGPFEHIFTDAGCYDVSLTVTSTDGCTATLTDANVICVEANPVASFNPSPATLSTNSLTSTMFNTSLNATEYQWTFFDDGSSSVAVDPTHTFPENSGTYEVMLVALSPMGCSDTAYREISVEEELIYYIPNTFTPDNDQFNQTFQPVFYSGFDPYDFTLLIFDRWGELIFESHDASIGWDGTYMGKIVMEGVYTWKIEFKTRASDERKTAVGHINLLR